MCLTIDLNKPNIPYEELYNALLAKIREHLKTATQDIVCIKALVERDGRYFSVNSGQNFEYEVGKTYEEPRFLVEDVKGQTKRLLLRANGEDYPWGFLPILQSNINFAAPVVKNIPQTVESLIQSLRRFEINYGFHSWIDLEKAKRNSSYPLYQFTILAGAEYFVNEEEGTMCSNKIRFDKVLNEGKDTPTLVRSL